MMNFEFAIPIKTRAAQVVVEALIHRVICILGQCNLLIADKNLTFMAEVIQFILRAINCKLKLISISIGLN